MISIGDTLNAVIKDGRIDFSAVGLTEEFIKQLDQIYMVVCGSVWHVGMAAQYVIEDMASVPVRVELASEFRYRKMPLNKNSLVIVISQSGETADTLAGPEISVATTKAYSAQLAAAYCLAVQLAKVRGHITGEQYAYYITELESIPEKIKKIVFFIGRGIDYAVGLEGSLKLKEISYIHSEAYAAGELKHGTISLIEEGTLLIGILTQSELYEKP